MEDQELRLRIKALEDKTDKIYSSVERTRKYFLWTMIGTVVLFVLPLVALMFVVPQFISTYASIGNF